MPIDFEFVNSEVNPAMANIVSPSEVVVVCTFHVELDGGGGDLHVTMPYSMLEPLREVLDAGMQSDVDEVDERWVKALQDDIMAAEVELNCEVANRTVSLRDILDLQTGDIIPIDAPDNLLVTANGVPVFESQLGQTHGNLALRVSKKMGEM